MKRLALLSLLLIMCIAAVPALAQNGGDVIILNDATPSIDVVVTLPPDSTGALALNLAGASVQLTDAANNIVFQAADSRLHALELNIAPNSGTHTLTVQRLPGVATAAISVTSLAELTLRGTPQRVEGTAVGLNQETSVGLNPAQPGTQVAVSIPAQSTALLTATFPGAGAASQLVDSAGVVVAQSTSGQVDGINFMLDGGNYRFTVLARDLAQPVVTGMRLIPAQDAGFTALALPETAPSAVAAAAPIQCAAQISASSVNLRSGPGTGYSILGYAYRDQAFTVGGRNPQSNWLVISTPMGSAWMSAANAQLQGACDNLTVFDIPLRDAAAPVILTFPQQPVSPQAGGEHEGGEHEDGDD